MANISKIAVGGTEYDIAGVGLIATIEETLTASKLYNVGDQFVYNGLLYVATQTIASGTAISIGSNCQLADKVADQLTQLNAHLSDSKKHDIGTHIDLSSYTTWASPYTIPADGYVYIEASASGSVTYGHVFTDGVGNVGFSAHYNNEVGMNTLYVRKGMKVVFSFVGTGSAWFNPFI